MEFKFFVPQEIMWDREWISRINPVRRAVVANNITVYLEKKESSIIIVNNELSK